jgi:hypothetical protein
MSSTHSSPTRAAGLRAIHNVGMADRPTPTQPPSKSRGETLAQKLARFGPTRHGGEALADTPVGHEVIERSAHRERPGTLGIAG